MSYEHIKPRKLDQTNCELFDDFPYISLQEKILKAQASGQAYDELIRSMYSVYDPYDNADPEDVATDLDSAENGVDQIVAYENFMKHRLEKDLMLKQYRQSELKKNENAAAPAAAPAAAQPHPEKSDK